MQLVRGDERLLLSAERRRGALRAAAVVAGIFGAPVLADLVGNTPSGWAVAVEDAVVLALLHGAMQVDRAGWLPHDPRAVHATALQLAAVGAVLSGWAHRSRSGGAILTGVFAVGAFVLAGAVVGNLVIDERLGLGAAAAFALGHWGAGNAGPASRTGQAAAGGQAPTGDAASPAPPSGCGLRAGRAWWPALWGAALFGVPIPAMTLLASGPGDEPAPLHWLERWQGLPGPPAAPLFVLAAVAVVTALRQASPAARRLRLAAAALSAAGCLLLSSGPASMALGPCAWWLGAARGGGPWWSGARLALLSLLHVAAWAAEGFLACGPALADPSVRRLLDRQGVFSAAITQDDGQEVAFLTVREDATVLRLPLSTLVADGFDLRTLPVRALDRQVLTGRKARAFPEEVAVMPGGEVLAFSELPGEVPTVLVTRHRPDGTLGGFAEWPGFCNISSVAWDNHTQRVLAGCEWRSRVLRFDPRKLDDVESIALPGEGEVEGLVQAHPGGPWYAVSLWSGSRLRAFDPGLGRLVGELEIGTFQWALAPSADGTRLYVARFFAGQLWGIDTAGLERRTVDAVPFGVRAVADDARHGVVLAASTYAGTLSAVDPSGRQPTRELRIGGWVRDIDLFDEGRSALVAGHCGVLAVDLDGWLGAAGSAD